MEDKPIYEIDVGIDLPDPDHIPIRDRKVITKSYDMVVETLVSQIESGVIFLRPFNKRPNFQRNYVWTNKLASRLIESILLNVPIPPCYLSQNEDFELDVIDGQQRLFSMYRFVDNQFKLSDLEVLDELNGLRFFELPTKIQRQIKTHTINCTAITNESHPEIKFDVFERLNTNTVPLNAQELRNCVYRGALNDLLGELSFDNRWLGILGKKKPDKRLRDEEVILRFFAFHTQGVENYKTPLKTWLNEAAKAGRRYPEEKVDELRAVWSNAIDVSTIWFEPERCFRREGSRAINRALFDLIMHQASQYQEDAAIQKREDFLRRYNNVLLDGDFQEYIGRSVDHKKRTIERFRIWDEAMAGL